jgi:glycosyltransferase involved in cell wall biosynthesis
MGTIASETPAATTPSEGRPLTVGICIGTYNQGQYIGDAIASALAQSYPVQQILVSDDCSSDNTEDVVAKFCAESPIVHYYRQPRNLRISGNLSWALAQPKTDFVVRLDSDDRLEPNYVEVLVALMAKYPTAGFAHSDVFEMDGQGARTRVRRLARSAEFESADESLRRSASGFRVSANCLLFRSVALAQAQYYLPTEAWSACEDWSLSLRIAAHGWGNVYAPQPLTNYRQWNDALNTRVTRKMEELTNMIDIYENTLIPEFVQRGWDTAILHKNMRKRAISFVDTLAAPSFTDSDRESLKSLMRKLGNSFSLSIAIVMAEHGLYPLIRQTRLAIIRTKDLAKWCLRLVKSGPAGKRESIAVQGNAGPAENGEVK